MPVPRQKGLTDTMGSQRWPVDRKIPVVFVLALLVQTITVVGAGSWFASRAFARLDMTEAKTADTAEAVDQLIPRVVRSETLLENLTQAVAEINMTLRSQETRGVIRENAPTRR